MLRIFNHAQRYRKPNVPAAVTAYAGLARQFGITPAQLALGFLRSRPFVCSTIVGVTSMAQLQENLGSRALNSKQLQAIELIHLQYPNPAP